MISVDERCLAIRRFVEHLEEDLKAVKPELAKLFTAKGRSRREG